MDFLTNQNIVFYLLAYLVGSIPFGLILAKTFAGVDIKSQGSKSIGATNVLRVVKQTNPSLAKKLGIATVLLDALKGTLVLLVGIYYGVSSETLWAIAVLAVLGHCYSIYLGLEGGKGVATGLGVYIVLIPYSTLIGALVWIVCAKVLKISSLSSLLGLVAAVISAIFIYDDLGINSNVPMYLIAFIILYKHIPNIVRLIKGQESKVI
ncbi:glycerol-3-phosphate 1-O-acyltransferase PlsY [Aliarcobacter butzleri]|jgi:glycerol-3-phosphate acyltransferase PlsY|uniref:Glycerol-3-phosphate acyltransferase n=1 Tax=Arcobacter lacus TaxID=1912876 RepID=A0ABX5JGJ1_9BACT|nr:MULTISPECIES: glycerol-3-phosphate 1-O-acyltransferase PlsY [Arcobacteraceae]MCG3656355.1 glycerol-3-phosphate 1-O-acyltransferase PlsY [Aliarcobacter butzleri]MCT7638966.1 glycerol-3-phosphate 1-O-acyltransferase PlsY [Aliarcobacter butzleri]MCT7910980.1 glycerol-3-phosphate 1-O-acyltransferase PlsY [Arcobacter lacus]MDK2047168.1 glycerol-3-phosphate 1-O-acyltransferase PlsY [Aliarcobacter butzleri]MDK2050803.1 glycerol-3-phosphate 1-O-acyltransferase PlsY [Aliarcobacter butzleri]